MVHVHVVLVELVPGVQGAVYGPALLHVPGGHELERLEGSLLRLYVALSPDFSDFDFDLDGPDASPNVFVDVADYWQLKSGGLRLYRSQEDAQEFASYLEANFFVCETFHQAYPPLADGEIRLGL